MADTWQTIEQAAVSLGISVRTVNRHMAAGKLPSRLNAEGRREVLVSLPDEPASAPPESPARPKAPKIIGDTVPPSNPFEATASAASDAVTGTWSGMAGASSSRSAAEPAPPRPPEPEASRVSHNPAHPVSVDAETVLALADNAAQKAEMAVTAYQTLARVADTQVRQSRRQARLAWAATVAMAAGVTVTVAWATRHITRASADVERLQDQLVAGKQDLRMLSDKQEQLRAEHAQAEQNIRKELTAREEKTLAERLTAEQALRGELVTAREQAARAEGQLAALREQEQARQARETVAAAAAVTTPPPVLSFHLPRRDPFETAAPAGGLETLAGFATSGTGWADTSDTSSGKVAEPEKIPAPTTRQSTLRAKAKVAAAPSTRPSVEP
jgi:hypothetical protein